MGCFSQFFFTLLCLIPSILCQFISIDCGGTSNYTDQATGLEWISDAGITSQGKSVKVENTNGNSKQYQSRRDFPTDTKKYSTFLYGTSVTGGTYTKFQLYLDATKWSTVTVMEASRVYVKEVIIRAPSHSINVCLCCATTGSPFISTLEMRPLNLSMYATDYEDDFYLEVAQRVNFWAPSLEAINKTDLCFYRYTYLVRRPNFLVGVAPGTHRINTTKHIDVNTREYPPVGVVQTAFVGTKGRLSYRLNLEDFPANARAYAYFAEIEDLGVNETRKFKMKHYMNVTLHFLLSFSFVKTQDSTRGPLLNAIEISRYAKINAKTGEQDEWSEEGYDPCISTNWEWVTCRSSTHHRGSPRCKFLSGKNMKGEIPPELKKMEGVTELWLDGNSLSVAIPDMNKLVNLKILHLENNQLTGPLPSYLGSLPNLQELYIQNNSLTGEIPPSLLSGNLTFKYEGNPDLRRVTKTRNKLVLGTSVGALSLLFILSITSIIMFHRGSLMDEGVAYYIPLLEIEEATNNFSKKIGKGSFGPVYYGKLQDGKEVAVKTMADSSSHGTKQFVTEVALLSRIHHRNLVPLIGYCEEEHQRMLVYEYIHNGTVRDHKNGSDSQKHLVCLARLRIAEDAAKGLEYLHTGCNPSIVHGDVKTSNILLDINMRAKVSDFGLSRQAEEDLTHISSVARGTVGYLDPGFGVVLLELISGRKPVSTEEYGADWSIVHWPRLLIQKGDVISITDPTLEGSVKIESIWRIAEVAIQCVEQHGFSQSSRRTILTSFLDIKSPDLSNGSLVPSAR
ncbi:hypothetical protein Pfo_009297 [Paulownia fortunei]|nr:hypothetical protein Pfo_009297 [Paulownia fortunei]